MSRLALLLEEHQRVMVGVGALLPALSRAAELVVGTLQAGNKVLLCGNGGSAADAQHIAAEIIGRFEIERQPLPAIALTTDTSILTALANDYGFEQLFARQVAGLGRSGDVLLAYSTSGNSGNVLAAVQRAKQMDIAVIVLSGKGGGQLSALADIELCVPSMSTARIQEAHAFIGHALCSAVDAAFSAQV